uniref:NTF2 domain-containing protein n=1 Tax=Macaca nemestrina TaxID=9545 RepID=A0A2K6DWG8_MACNE
MVMEKPTPLLVGWKFVRQHYALVNQALDMLHRFYGKNSSHVHGGLDSNGKKVMSQNFTNCHTKILHVDAYAMLNNGVVVQVMVLLSNNNQALRRFMQMFVLAPEGSIAYQFYVHNDILRHQDGFVTEPQEESEEEVEEPEERHNDMEEHLEEPVAELEPDPEPEPEQEHVSEIQEEKFELVLEETAPEDAQKSSLAPEDLRTFSWASVTSNNLPPSGAVPVTGIPPHVCKVLASQPCTESKPESQGPRAICEAGEQGDIEPRRMVRHPDSHQLFIGNLLHKVDKSELKDFFQNYGNMVEFGGKLPNFDFVVFDDSEPVQKVLSNRSIMFRGEVRDPRDDRLCGPGGPLGGLGGGMRGPPCGGMVQKAGFGVGRWLAPRQ